MTEILLAHGFYLANDRKQKRRMFPYPPLGTLYAAGHLRSRGHEVALFDALMAEEADFTASLEGHRPRILVLYEDTFNFLNKMCLLHARQANCRMAARAKEQGAIVLVAGSDVTDHPEEYLAAGVDYALLGEADHTVVELVDALTGRRKAHPREIPGLAFLASDTANASDSTGANGSANRGSKAMYRTPPRLPERQPDVFPFPAWDLIDTERYRRTWNEVHGHFALGMVTTRGCPFHCNWCAKPIWGQSYAMRSPANVAEEMARVKQGLAPDRLWFADDIFGLQPRWVEAFADEVESRDAAIPFRIQSRVDLMTPRAVEALARAGCHEVWLGVESGSQKVLDSMDKGTRVEAIPAARERLKSAGIRAGFFLQFGYPGETWEDILATVALVRQTLPDEIGVSVSYPLPGTRFHAMVREQLTAKDHWEDSHDLSMMFQGTYQTPFYRHLHGLVHRDLALTRQRAEALDSVSEEEAAEVETGWRELERLERECRSDSPTALPESTPPRPIPDLSRSWGFGGAEGPSRSG